jgi:hypothetical protein
MEIEAVMHYRKKQGIYLSFASRIDYISPDSISILLSYGLLSSDQVMADKPYYPILPFYNSEKVCV